MDGAGCRHGHVGRDPARRRELPEQAEDPRLVTGDVGVGLGVAALEEAGRDERRAAVPRAGQVDHLLAGLLDQPRGVGVDEAQARARAPVAQEARLDVLGGQRLGQQGVVPQVDLPHGQVVVRAPPGIERGDLVVGRVPQALQQLRVSSCNAGDRRDGIHLRRPPVRGTYGPWSPTLPYLIGPRYRPRPLDHCGGAESGPVAAGEEHQEHQCGNGPEPDPPPEQHQQRVEDDHGDPAHARRTSTSQQECSGGHLTSHQQQAVDGRRGHDDLLPAGAHEGEQAAVGEVLVDLRISSNQTEVHAAHHQEEPAHQRAAERRVACVAGRARLRGQCRGHRCLLRCAVGSPRSLVCPDSSAQGTWSRLSRSSDRACRPGVAASVTA